MTPDSLLTLLTDLGIEHRTVDHPPMRTVEDSQRLRGNLPGGHFKNLFLKDKKGQFFLVVAGEERPVNLKSLREPLDAAHLSFGKPEALRAVLGVEPGAVTPFGLANDRDAQQILRVGLDRPAVTSHEWVHFHPLSNEKTTAIRSTDLSRFLDWTGHEVRWLDLEAPSSASNELERE